jgi:hypothetical protein
MVALAIWADGEPVRPARRKQRNLAINLVKMSVSAWRMVFPGRQDAGLYGRRDARLLHFQTASHFRRPFPHLPLVSKADSFLNLLPDSLR